MKTAIIIFVAIISAIAGIAQVSPKIYKTSPIVKPNPAMFKVPLPIINIVTTPVSNAFPAAIKYKRYILPDYGLFPASQPKGCLLMTHFSTFNYDIGMLDAIAKQLVQNGIVVAIIAHRGDRTSDWSTDVQKVLTDFKNVFSHLQSQYPSLTNQNTVAGGWSYTGQILSSAVYSDTWVKQLKGLLLISAGGKEWGNVPIINKVCKDDPVANDEASGNYGGDNLQQKLQANLPAIAAQSYCETDFINCSGHQYSDTWANFFIDKLKTWFR